MFKPERHSCRNFSWQVTVSFWHILMYIFDVSLSACFLACTRRLCPVFLLYGCEMWGFSLIDSCAVWHHRVRILLTAWSDGTSWNLLAGGLCLFPVKFQCASLLNVYNRYFLDSLYCGSQLSFNAAFPSLEWIDDNTARAPMTTMSTC